LLRRFKLALLLQDGVNVGFRSGDGKFFCHVGFSRGSAS
jgi:hypothetical protein